MSPELVGGNEQAPAARLYEEEFTSEHLPKGYTITRALPNDIDTIIIMRERIAEKLRADSRAGNQWNEPWPDDITQVERIAQSVAKGETYMVWGGESGIDLVGTFALSTKGDGRLWTPAELEADDAVYLSRLMSAEKGIGDDVIRTAKDWSLLAGKKWLRIDVWDANTKLKNYYRRGGRGFHTVRNYPIDNYPSCTLMQAATDVTVEDKRVKQAVEEQNQHMLELPLHFGITLAAPLSWNFTIKDTGRPWSFSCPRPDQGWVYHKGNVVTSLRYSPFLTEAHYNKLLREVGIAPLMVNLRMASGNPQAILEPVSTIRHADIYEATRHKFPEEELVVEGVLGEGNTVILTNGEIPLGGFQTRVYRLPTNAEHGCQPGTVVPGDSVHVRFLKDGTSADILKFEDGTNNRRDRDDMEHTLRQISNKIYECMQAGEVAAVHAGVQRFHEIDGPQFPQEEQKLRSWLQRNGYFAVEPFMLELGFVDRCDVGDRASAVCDRLIERMQEGDISDLQQSLRYFRSFVQYPTEYSKLSQVMMESAQRLACEDDLMRTVYAKLVRDCSMRSPTYRASFDALVGLIPPFVRIRGAVSTVLSPGEV